MELSLPCRGLCLSLSKNQLERELHRSCPTHLILRIQDAQRICERACRLSKRASVVRIGRLVRRAQDGVDSSEIRVVEDIESLRAELQRQTLMDGKLPANRQIHLPGPETSNEVAWRGSGATRHERSEERRVG